MSHLLASLGFTNEKVGHVRELAITKGIEGKVMVRAGGSMCLVSSHRSLSSVYLYPSLLIPFAAVKGFGLHQNGIGKEKEPFLSLDPSPIHWIHIGG